MNNNEELLYLEKKTDLGPTDNYYPKETWAFLGMAGYTRKSLSAQGKQLSI